jgi:hypothetical protein
MIQALDISAISACRRPYLGAPSHDGRNGLSDSPVSRHPVPHPVRVPSVHFTPEGSVRG